VLLNFPFNKKSCITVYTKKNIKQHFFNIGNTNKCFLDTKSSYQNDFWRIMWHWRLE